jgi:SAM-dependent methyltransferase
VPDAGAREYVLGTSDDEVVRLGFQHRAWAAQAFAAWERAGFARGQTLLDAGCGPGYATVDLAHLVGPSGRVIAVDESRKYIDLLTARLSDHERAIVEPRVGDVQRLELVPSSIDGAYARWVLCFVPDPEAVIAAVARALTPGGTLAVQDYFNFRALSLAPRSVAMERVVAAVEASWRARGGDPDIAGRLPALLERRGLRVRSITPHLRVARPGSALWSWPDLFFRSFVPALVGMGHLTREEQAAFEADWAARSADPSAFYCTPPVFDIVATKA